MNLWLKQFENSSSSVSEFQFMIMLLGCSSLNFLGMLFNMTLLWGHTLRTPRRMLSNVINVLHVETIASETLNLVAKSRFASPKRSFITTDSTWVDKSWRRRRRQTLMNSKENIYVFVADWLKTKGLHRLCSVFESV